MKNTILKTKYIVIGLFLMLAVSCSSDDTVQVNVPSVKYESTNIEAIFFEDGETSAPTISWNGDVGSFTINTSINGLSIDNVTGKLSWTQFLPEGIHEVEVVAENSAGQQVINLHLDNTLQGKFIGTLTIGGTVIYFETEFKPNGEVILGFVDPSDPTKSPGVWEKRGNQFIVNSFSGGDLSLKGNISQTETSASYTGSIYKFHDAVEGNQVGSFSIEFAGVIFS